MRSFLRRVLSIPATVIGLAASLCFASSHVWAQTAPRASRVSTTRIVSAAPSIGGEVRDVAIRGDSIEVTYRNTGTQPTAIVGVVQVHLTEDEALATIVFADATVIKPGVTQRFRAAMPKLAKGRYTLYAIVDFGGETMTAAQATLQLR